MKTLPAALGLAAVLVACGGGTPSALRSPIPCPEGPIPAPPQLLYPSPNASAVPDGNFSLLLGDPYGNIVLWSQPVLVPANGGQSVTAGPYAIVPTPGTVEYSSAVPALARSTAYAVNLTTPVTGGPCATTETLGSFTTQ